MQTVLNHSHRASVITMQPLNPSVFVRTPQCTVFMDVLLQLQLDFLIERCSHSPLTLFSDKHKQFCTLCSFNVFKKSLLHSSDMMHWKMVNTITLIKSRTLAWAHFIFKRSIEMHFLTLSNCFNHQPHFYHPVKFLYFFLHSHFVQ